MRSEPFGCCVFAQLDRWAPNYGQSSYRCDSDDAFITRQLFSYLSLSVPAVSHQLAPRNCAAAVRSLCRGYIYGSAIMEVTQYTSTVEVLYRQVSSPLLNPIPFSFGLIR